MLSSSQTYLSIDRNCIEDDTGPGVNLLGLATTLAAQYLGLILLRGKR